MSIWRNTHTMRMSWLNIHIVRFHGELYRRTLGFGHHHFLLCIYQDRRIRHLLLNPGVTKPYRSNVRLRRDCQRFGHTATIGLFHFPCRWGVLFRLPWTSQDPTGSIQSFSPTLHLIYTLTIQNEQDLISQSRLPWIHHISDYQTMQDYYLPFIPFRNTASDSPARTWPDHTVSKGSDRLFQRWGNLLAALSGV